jgi:FMN phosphatase YigB (HAD superfamily)
MTSQVLTPSRSSEAAPQAGSSTNRSAALLEGVKLPYQVDHQVELLHLRAEAEALLQELQTLKQRRLVLISNAETISN